MIFSRNPTIKQIGIPENYYGSLLERSRNRFLEYADLENSGQLKIEASHRKKLENFTNLFLES